MAELLIKINSNGPNPKFQDGDIVTSFNDRRILQVHTEHAARTNAHFKNNVLRDENSLFYVFCKETYEYIFERVSKYEVKRTSLIDGSAELFSNIPKHINGTLQYIDVPLFLARRLKYRRHAIFGNTGAEFWFSGKRDFSMQKLESFWPNVEDRAKIKRDQCTRWPLTHIEKKHFLGLGVDDFSDAKSSHLLKSITVEILEDVFLTTQARQCFCEWKSLMCQRSRSSRPLPSPARLLERFNGFSKT